jgi:peptide/nickel transport system permease protein
MIFFLFRRFMSVFVILLLVSLVIFGVTEILPGDTATFMLGQRATPDLVATLRKQMGLDRPASVRYIEWITNILHGDWGESLLLKTAIWPLLQQRFGNTLVLAFLTILLGTPLGIGLGLLAGLNQGRWLDQTIIVFTTFIISIPSFIVAIFMVIIFSAYLQWLPASSMIASDANLGDRISRLILPILTLISGMLAHLTRHTRSSLITVLQADYLRTARGKGLAEGTVIFRHALPNALLPTITVVALNVGWLIGGVVLVETVFAYPGLGQLMVQALSSRDIPLLQAISLVTTASFTLANFAADLLYMVLNPRVRYQ